MYLYIHAQVSVAEDTDGKSVALQTSLMPRGATDREIHTVCVYVHPRLYHIHRDRYASSGNSGPQCRPQNYSHSVAAESLRGQASDRTIISDGSVAENH